MEKSITRKTSSEKQFGSSVDKRDELENATDGPEIVEQSSTDDQQEFEQSKSQPSVKQKKDKRIVRGMLLGILLCLIDIGLIILIFFLLDSHKTLIEQLDNQQKDIYKLKQCSALYAGFTLNLSDEEETGYPWIEVSSGHTVKFEKVMENAGQGYDPKTGKFTAAISGLYSFQINIVAWEDKRACIALKKGREDPIVRAFAKGGYWESGSASAVVEMAAGDVMEAVACVDSRFSAYTSDPAYGRSTVFSGHLIEVANCSSSPLVLKPDVSSSDWQLVFRGRSLINTPMYEAYTSSPSPPVTQITCKHPFALPCDTHYRNDLALDNWQDVDEVAFVVYRGGQRVAWAVFDGAGSSYLSWFSKQTLKDSHWTDLTKTSQTNFFSLDGDSPDNSKNRNFFISKLYKGCQDVGWFVVVDSRAGHCNWETFRFFGFPQILYSKRKTVSNWNSKMNIGHADDFVVYVKYVDGTVLG